MAAEGRPARRHAGGANPAACARDLPPGRRFAGALSRGRLFRSFGVARAVISMCD